MGYFKRDRNSTSSGRNFRSSREDRDMFQAVCANCGKDCQVPFKPNGRKPVLCSACFDREGGSEPARFRNEERGPRPSFRPQRNDQLEEVNAKLDRILKILGQRKD